jgi:predicted Holliday junction resolvase-like endonuclease
MVQVLIYFLILIVLVFLIWIVYKLGLRNGRTEKELEWQGNLGKLRRDIADKQRVNIKGKVSEVFAPFLEGFPFKASECKFLGDPIDYVVFEGLDERDVKGVHLVEVKTGKSKLSKHQKQIKDLIGSLDSKKVKFHEFRFLDSGTTKDGELEEWGG